LELERVGMSKSRIIYIAPRLNTFTSADINFLSEKYDVLVSTFDWKKKSLLLFFAIRQVFFLLLNIFRVKTIVISFGGYWSFLPSLFGMVFRKNVYIILNGADSAYIPELKYGFLKKGTLLYWMCRKSYEWADILLPVSDSLIKTENTFIPLQNPKQGILNHFPDLKTPWEVIPNGLNVDMWFRDESIIRDKNSFLAVFSSHQLYLKGADLISEMAERFPDYKFYIIGITESDVMSPKQNLKLLGRKSPEELREYYNHCQFYFQLSASESFGIALCEAMLCEAIPIGSSVNIIPQIIGNAGFILAQRDAKLLSEIIQKAVNTSDLNSLGKKGRKSILERYPIEKRIERLTSIIGSGT
jgi:glycosyltransferase involved in cell wall biosynthesis